jgi:type IV pilus assembly protein PilC
MPIFRRRRYDETGDPQPVITSQADGDVPPNTSKFLAKRVGGKDLMQFSRQLASFVRAGIPILDALSLLEQDTANPTLKSALFETAEGLRRGESLSTAFEAHPKVFPIAYRSMLRSAELTGNLDTVLDDVSEYLEREVEARAKLKAAMIYPAVIVVMSIGVVILLTTFVLPKFVVFFKSFHQKLPLATRMLLNFAAFSKHYGPLVLVIHTVLTIAGLAWIRGRRGRPVLDRLLLRLPVLGPALRFALVERFCRILASMTRSGVSVPEAMSVAGAAMNNHHVSASLDVARQEMMEGQGIAGPLARTGLFPPAAAQMLRVGEDTGQLDLQLEAAAKFYARELDYKIKRITALIEPAIIVAMGIVVGFVSIALISAMYGVFHGAKV